MKQLILSSFVGGLAFGLAVVLVLVGMALWFGDQPSFVVIFHGPRALP